MIKLSDIILGYVDGKNEAQKDWFTDLFYTDNNMVEKVSNDPAVFIISGRKGTGKTILAKYIEKKYKENGVVTKVIDKEELFLHYILEKTSDQLNQAELSAFLRYCILIAIAQQIVENEKNAINELRVTNGIFSIFASLRSIKRLKRFYNDVYPKGAFKSYSGEQEVESTKSGDIGKDSIIFSHKNRRSRKNLLDRKKYFELLQELEHLIFEVAKYLDFFVFFDDLDELESRRFLSDSTEHIFITLLNTVQSLNMKLQEQGHKKSKVIVLLRSDILEDLNTRSSNLNKMIVDGCVNLNWIKPSVHDENHPLMDLLLTKMQKSCFKQSRKTKKEIYEELFEWFKRKAIIDYLMENSFGRPRDTIMFLNTIIREYPDANHFDHKMFESPECKKQYSKSFTNELKNELSIHFTEEEILDMFGLLEKQGKKAFSYNDVQEYYEQNKMLFPTILDLQETLKSMYKFGIIGNTWRIGKEGQYQYRSAWAYREDGHADADFSKRFCVHIALRRELKVK